MNKDWLVIWNESTGDACEFFEGELEDVIADVKRDKRYLNYGRTGCAVYPAPTAVYKAGIKEFEEYL